MNTRTQLKLICKVVWSKIFNALKNHSCIIQFKSIFNREPIQWSYIARNQGHFEPANNYQRYIVLHSGTIEYQENSIWRRSRLDLQRSVFRTMTYTIWAPQIFYLMKRKIKEDLQVNLWDFSRQSMTVSFETPNLCTFLLGLFRFIISSLVNDYYLISFYFNQFHLSTCTRYCISYFIAISCCRRHQFSLLFMYDTLSAIHLQSLGTRPK